MILVRGGILLRPSGEKKWKPQLYSYVTEELPELLKTEFPELCVYVGYIWAQYGGHGALICALKNPGKYRSVSAFLHLIDGVSLGSKTFSGYLGEDNTEWWKRYDATELVSSYEDLHFMFLWIKVQLIIFMKNGACLRTSKRLRRAKTTYA